MLFGDNKRTIEDKKAEYQRKIQNIKIENNKQEIRKVKEK